MVLVVTEPTLSGLHDLQRVAELTAHFTIPTCVCVNKYDINPQVTENIRTYCAEHDLSFIGVLPYDLTIVKALVRQTPVVEYTQEAAAQAIMQIWQRIEQSLEQPGK
jgi:MinD superfamily P-loop ATPase